MSSGMNMKEAEKIADKMTYREAIMNCLYAKCVPYRKATKIKMKRLLEDINQIRAEAIDECIALFDEYQPRLSTHVSEFKDALKQLKERK